MREIEAGSGDTWTTVEVDRGGSTYYTDARYYFVDMDELVTAGLLSEPPASAASDNCPTSTCTGSYIYYVDERGLIKTLYTFFPTSANKGYIDGVHP